MENLLEVSNLVVEYTSDGEVIHAVNDVSFELKEGKTLGLVGETGAGKTTIVKSIIDILPDPPARIKQGTINYNGKEILKLNAKEKQDIRGKEISMIFQDPMTALNPIMRVGGQIEEVIALHNPEMNRKEVRNQAIKMLEMVGITSDRLDEYPHQFSGGMKQRIVIAMALACNPKLLLADEPTTALDVTIQAQVLGLINELKKKQNTSMILVTHALGVIAETCDDVAVVYAGQIVEKGTLKDVFDHPSHPYTIGLFKAIPDIHSDVERLTPIEGMPPNPSDLPSGCYFSPRCPFAKEECYKKMPQDKEVSKGHICKCFYPQKKGDRL
ncbi:MAG: ABC transporter ATP-binding protein [Erysipelotrichaceae bacterium]|nr:ABC transporter ATP-binding protein [Erysipelotrichaceae bacterium]